MVTVVCTSRQANAQEDPFRAYVTRCHSLVIDVYHQEFGEYLNDWADISLGVSDKAQRAWHRLGASDLL